MAGTARGDSAVRVLHPFTPASLVIPDYKPNLMSIPDILTAYFGAVLVAFTVTLIIFRRDKYNTSLKFTERLLMCWFSVSGFTHLILEAGYVRYGRSIVWRQDILSECLKEYGRADSRYVTGHSGVYAIEFITVFLDGPGCFIIMWMTFNRSAGRYATEMLVSAFQLYGTIFYYLEAYFDNFKCTPFNDPYLFWFYFVGLNSIWVIIPIIVIIRDVMHMVCAQSLLDDSNTSVQKQMKKTH